MPQPRKVIASVQRALDILDLFDSRRSELGNAEIARLLGLPVGTAAGLIHTLKHNGYLAQNPATRKYRLGFKLTERARVLLDQLDLRRIALPHLEELHAWCGESVNLGILDGPWVVYIERLHSRHSLGIRSELGKRAPLHSTALGKALLAFQPPAALERFLAGSPLEPVTPHTLTDPADILAELDATRRRGYAIDEQENEIGGRCVAAPVFDAGGLPAAALSISAPVQRLPAERVEEFGRQVQSAATQISRALGFAPYGSDTD